MRPKISLRSLTILLLLCAVPPSMHSRAEEEKRGGHVSWARLKTSNQHWQRHSQRDGLLLSFIRDHTNLGIDPSWQVADINDLEALCQYPFLFSEGIHRLIGTHQHNNMSEFLRRGGFIFIDACINTREVNPDPDVFLANQVEVIQRLLPEATVTEIPPDHPIYSVYFQMKNGLPHSFMESIPDPKWAKFGLHAVEFEGRTVAIISLSGIQCGWARTQHAPGHDVECMKMMVNLYIHAMTNQ